MEVIPYSRQLICEDDIASVADVLRTDWLTCGPKLEEFENAFADYTDAKYAVAFANGTAALHALYLAAGIKAGDEVIVPTITFAATANAAIMCGAKPKFVDIDPRYGLIDPDSVERAISKRTKAVIAVHYAGHPADIDTLKKIGNRRGLVYLEDACHAFGSLYKSKKIGSQSRCAFSLHPVKPITSAEGGVVTTDSKAIAAKLKTLRHHGIDKSEKLSKRFGEWFYQIRELGFNYRMSELHAALGLSQLKKADEFKALRRKLVSRYVEAFKDIDEIQPVTEPLWGESTYHLFAILVKPHKNGMTRRKLFDALLKKNIRCQVHYIPLHYQPYYQKLLKVKRGDFPNAELFYSCQLSLPLYAGLSEREQDYIIASIKELWGMR